MAEDVRLKNLLRWMENIWLRSGMVRSSSGGNMPSMAGGLYSWLMRDSFS